MRFPRDLRGYGPNPPDPDWPDGARLALQFVIHYDEAGEALNDEPQAESGQLRSSDTSLSNLCAIDDYGMRAGFWRLHRMFTAANIPVTVFANATALARSPENVAAMKRAGWDIAALCPCPIDRPDYDATDQIIDLDEAITLHGEVVGDWPRGIYLGRPSVLKIAATIGGIDWISDAHDDDLPYWLDRDGAGNTISPRLVIPHAANVGDLDFATGRAVRSGDSLFIHLKDTFDTLYAEGEMGRPAMMSIALHCRHAGSPRLAGGLQYFLAYVRRQPKVWMATAGEIAAHWREYHPYDPPALRPSRMSRQEFVAMFGAMIANSPWIAERAFDLELGSAHDCAEGMHNALVRVFRSAREEERLAALSAQPDFAELLAPAKRVTSEWADELAPTGLDALTREEQETVLALSKAYTEKFGFPFIVAVRDHTRESVLSALRQRLDNSRATEFEAACRQVERITWLRVRDILPV